MKNSGKLRYAAAVGFGVVALGMGGWLSSRDSESGEREALSQNQEVRKRQVREGVAVGRSGEGPALAGVKKRPTVGAESAETPARPPFQFDRKGVKVDSWVAEVRALHGTALTPREREAAMAFLAGDQVPEGMGKGSIQWLSDEVLTALRLQEPPWKGLAAALAEAAFQPTTDPVVRDYIMQHFGHWWEQTGAQPEIESALWLGVETADPTTPGTALIALDNGYQRDQRADELARVRGKALELAESPNATLAVRSTALSVAAEGGGREAKELATRLAGDSSAPLILRRVAEHALKK